MGFKDNQSGKFISIYNGKLCVRGDKDTPGAIERVNKVGKTVYEIFHDKFVGKLTDIKVTDSDYGKNWNFMFQDEDEAYTLQLGYSNSFAVALLKMLPNIDLSKEFSVSPSSKEVDGKKQNSLFVNQDGSPVKHFYTKDNPNGLPQLKELTVRGQQVWDDTDRIAFLKDMVDQTILPKLHNEVAVKEVVKPVSKQVVDDEDDNRDLDF